MIETAARTVAAAEQTLDEAKAHHQEASSACESLKLRIVGLTEQMADIRRDRQSGKMTDLQAAGLFGILQEDLADLQKMAATADAGVASSAAVIAEAEAKLTLARNQLERAIQSERAQELGIVAKKLEAKLCDCISDIVEAGIMAGKTGRDLSQHWQPGPQLTRAMFSRVVPRREAHP